MGAPHVLSEHAASSVVSRSRRGVMTSECPRRLPVSDQASSRPRDTRSKRRLADAAVASGSSMPRWVTSRRVDAVYPSRDEASVRAGRRRGPLRAKAASTIPRYQRPSGVRRQNVRGTIFSRATTLNRGERLGIHRGRASASRSHGGRAAASSHHGRAVAGRRRQYEPLTAAVDAAEKRPRRRSPRYGRSGSSVPPRAVRRCACACGTPCR